MNELIQYPGFDGFLGTRASFMLDMVFVAMFVVIAIMLWSIYQVRYRKRYLLHKRTQIGLAGLLLVVVAAFEVDMRMHGWESRAAGEIGGSASSLVWRVLYLHLAFAITTVLIWPVVIVSALRNFPTEPAPSTHSRSHIFWARLAALDMLLTSISGWWFYYVAFV